MASPTFVGSRTREIDAMIREISAGLTDAPAHLPPPAAGTGGTEAVEGGHVAARQGRIGAMAQGADRDTVEHQRQCRLRSYQEQRDA